MSGASSSLTASRSQRSIAARNASAGLDIGFTPDLDGDLVDAQRNRRLGLGRLHPYALEVIIGEQAVGNRAAETLERLLRGLLGDQRDELTNPGVVDVALERVGARRVGLADVEPQVEHQPLADLTLGLGDAMMGVERKPADLDGDRLGGSLAIVVEIGAVVVV